MKTIYINDCEYQLEFNSIGYSAIVAFVDMEVDETPSVLVDELNREPYYIDLEDIIMMTDDMKIKVTTTE